MKQFQWEQLVSSKRIPPNQPKNDLTQKKRKQIFLTVSRMEAGQDTWCPMPEKEDGCSLWDV